MSSLRKPAIMASWDAISVQLVSVIIYMIIVLKFSNGLIFALVYFLIFEIGSHVA